MEKSTNSFSFDEYKAKAHKLFESKEASYLIQPTTYLLVLFINPISGSQEGQIIQDVAIANRDKDIDGYLLVHFPSKPSSQIEFFNEEPLDKNKQVFSVIFFNILDKAEYSCGVGFISAFLETSEVKLRILIGGGDGTVLRLVEYLNEFNIDLSRCYFGHIPLGTGNDLSNSMGFGNVVKLNHKMNQLHQVLSTYANAQECKIDIWKTSLYMKDDGFINAIQHDTEASLYEDGKVKKTMVKTFINYFSIGFDARVGFNFEQRRSANRTCNKMIYCWEASKRYLCCKKNITLPSILEAFHSIDDFKEENKNKANESNGFTSEIELSINVNNKKDLFQENSDDHLDNLIDDYSANRRMTIFRTIKENMKEFDKVTLRGNPVDIICQNINFYMGGTMNIWDNSSNIGLNLVAPLDQSMATYQNSFKSGFNQQRYDDKKIEFFTYDTGISMALERVAAGQADRIYQGKGPMIITFKQNPNDDEYAALNKVYFNVDGEFFHLLQPKELHIELNEDICDGQINFLRNES